MSPCAADGSMMIHLAREQGQAYQLLLEFSTKVFVCFQVPLPGVPREQLGSDSGSGPFSCPPEEGEGERTRLRTV